MRHNLILVLGALMFLEAPAGAMDEKILSPIELADHYQTSTETIPEKLDGLANKFVEQISVKMRDDSRYHEKPGVYEVIRKTDSGYNKGPLTQASNYEKNIEILGKDKVREAIRKFTDEQVDKRAEEINSVKYVVTKTWDAGLKKEFTESDLVGLTKSKLFQQTIDDYLANQKDNLELAKAGKIIILEK